MIKCCLAVACLFLSFFSCSGQSAPDSAAAEDLRFAAYLYHTRQYSDAIRVLQPLAGAQPGDLSDSINFLTALSYHSLQQSDSAAVYFARVKPEFSQYDRARFYAAFNYAYTGNLAQAETVLESFTPSDSGMVMEFHGFNRAGLSLLRRDLKTYDSLQQTFSYRYYPFSNQQKQFGQYAQTFREQKNRSPLVAAGLSAVVPGMGKVYAGRLGSGIATFIQMSVFGLQAWEGYRKGGTDNLQFQVFGSLFTVFYIGNIWGSALAVHVQKQEVYDVTRNQILFDLHIPLRTVFN